MSLLKKLTNFKPEMKRFSMLIDCLKFYIDANSVAAKKKVAVLLTVIEANSYALVSVFYNILKPSDHEEPC